MVIEISVLSAAKRYIEGRGFTTNPCLSRTPFDWLRTGFDTAFGLLRMLILLW